MQEKREMTYQILLGNNLDILPTLPDNSVDSIVTDPPYELGFMGKKWDSSGIAYSVELWQQCLRVLKPGGHLLAFSGSRTYHRMVVAIEDAGFEIRDMISWISNKTFPKSLNIEKATKDSYWKGWGTGLKPTVEPIVMARKPVEGTVANNVLTYGTGGLNIDCSRIAHDDSVDLNTMQRQQATNPIRFGGANPGDVISMYKPEGRWPANLIIDEDIAELLDQQSGQVGNGWKKNYGTEDYAGKQYAGGSFGGGGYSGTNTYADSGGASRFFYVARASKRDRNEGLDELEAKQTNTRVGDANALMNPVTTQPRQNNHPTVKPTTLMEYLIKLVTPPNGTVLDPFTGSGSTGKAAILHSFDFIGIEMTEEYLPIIEGRLKHAEAVVAEAKEQEQRKENEVLF